MASILVEVFGSERLLAQEFVEEAVVDGRADAELHVGEKFEHGGGQQMRRRMAEHLQRVGILRGEDRERGVALERARKIHQLAIGARDQRFLGQAVRNFCGDFGGRGAARALARGAVGQSDLNGFHGDFARGENFTLTDGSSRVKASGGMLADGGGGNELRCRQEEGKPVNRQRKKWVG